MDRRVIKTKAEIKKAYFELLSEKHFESITVRDITDRANINRGTFYLHFEDKYQVLDYYEEEIFSEIRSIFEKVLVEMNLQEMTDARISPILKMFKLFQKENYFINLMMGPHGDPLFKEKIRLVFVGNIDLYLEMYADMEQFKYPKDYILTYLSNAHVGIMIYWLENGAKKPPEEIIEMLMDILVNGPFKASGIENAIRKKN